MPSLFPHPHPSALSLAAPGQTSKRRTSWIQLDRLLHHELGSRDVLPHQIDQDVVLRLVDFINPAKEKALNLFPQSYHVLIGKLNFHK